VCPCRHPGRAVEHRCRRPSQLLVTNPIHLTGPTGQKPTEK
jgi:hypothetical protein